MNTLIDMMNPWNILADILDTDSRTWQNVRARAAGRFPPVNIYRDENAVLVDVELPGRTAKDVTLTLEPEAATIAERHIPEEGKTSDNVAPRWSRRIELPFRVDADRANAKFENGILRIQLPKMDAPGVRKIAIAE